MTFAPLFWNAARVPSAHADIPASYARLSAAARLVAQAYGIVGPMPMSIERTQQLLSKGGVRLLDRVVDQTLVRRSNKELTNAGMVFRYGNQGTAVQREWALPLTRAAHREGHLLGILRAFQQQQRHYWDEEFHDEALLRGYLVAGDSARVEEVLDDMAGPVDWTFLAEPLEEELLASVPKEYQPEALGQCLSHCIDTAAPAAPIIDICQTMGSTGHHAADIAFIRVLQGRFDAAHVVFDALPPSARSGKPAAVGRLATQALIACLQGDDAAALRHIEETIAAEKAGTRRRLVFPRCRQFALALLALLRIDSPQSLELLAELLRIAKRFDAGRYPEIALVTNAKRIKEHGGIFGTLPRAPNLEVLYDAFASCWMEDFHPQAEFRHRLLSSFSERAKANGFDWVASECAETLRRFDALHGGDSSLRQPSLADLQLGTRTLADLATPVAEWEYGLKALEQLAYKASSKDDAKSSKASAKRRLIWEFDNRSGHLLVGLREQRQHKNGGWSRGRQLALQRVVAEAANIDYLLPQDKQAIAAVTVRRYWGGQDHHIGSKSVYALVGHPHVYNRDGQSVDVVRRDPELSVEEVDADHVVVRIAPFAEDDREYVAWMAGDRRCEVTRFTPDHLNLCSAIGEQGLTLPTNAKSRLLEAVSTLASQIRVQSAADGEATAEQVPSDSEPWVRLEPLDAGLTAAVVVEPIAESDVCFEPGTGGATVFAVRDGKSVQARRDLDAENQAVGRLIDSCPVLASRPTELAPLTLPEPVQCLELLERLQAVDARCKWPKGEPFRIVSEASASSLRLTVKSAEQWLQASGALAVDDQRVLDLKRLFALLEASPQSRFLALGDGEFLALASGFRRQLDDLASLSSGAAKGEIRMNPLAALALDDLLEDADTQADDAWLAFRERLEEAETFDAEVPSTLQAELRPYQVSGYRWLARLSRWGAGACLADDMGLGKTVQTLAVLLQRAPDGPALVVAPTSVVANWTDEARRFAPTLNVKLYAGPAAARAPLLEKLAPFDLVVTTYGVLQNDAERLGAVAWHSAVLDEAQAIKNPTAKRTRAARRLSAAFRVVTTGTPIQNNLMDLHSLFGFVNPGLLGSMQQFRRNFGLPIERDADAEAQARLRRLIAPFVLRRLKADVLDDLPERTEITLHVTMSEEEATLYEALRQKAVEELEAARREGAEVGEGARRVQVLAQLTRLRLACCNPKLVLERGAPESSKLATFATTLEELLENRHKVLVFSQFVMHLKLVEEHLRDAGIDYQYLDGATPAKARRERIAAFQAGQGDVFLISLKAGGVGLNLTAADYVIHMDPWWNPAVEDQASDRAHRIGQTRPVTIYRLVTEGTIEEQIVDLHHRKRDLADQLLEGADAPGRLNADELLDLLRQPLRA